MAIDIPPVDRQPVKRSRSCWAIGGITCLTLLIITIALIYFLYVKFSKTPVFKNAYSNATQMSECIPHLGEISGALDRYKQKKGAYPAGLNDLYPDFLEDKSNLHCPSDASPTDTVSYTYERPDSKTQSEDRVVICSRHSLMNVGVLLVIQKNGKIAQYTIPPGKSSKPIKNMEMNPKDLVK